MAEAPNKPSWTLGLFAHVDAGKTTLSEALLYLSGARRTLGRVDHRDAFLDTDQLERERGITIFSKPARFETPRFRVTLIDTPGHVDFAPETERVMPVLDCGVLVISGVDGVQAHTLTLWRLLEEYGVPVFLFINKMDLPGPGREYLLRQLQSQLSPNIVDFTGPEDQMLENAALCDEALLENYLQGGAVTDANLQGLIARRKLFPVCFGAALKLEGVEELLRVLDRFAPAPEYPQTFAARVYKISRDPQGQRLTWVKLTGGALRPRDTLSYSNRKGEPVTERVQQLRRYAGEKFTAPDLAQAGEILALTGLTQTYAGQGLGTEPATAPPVVEPVMTYRIILPPDTDPMVALPKLKLLEEEEPQLHIYWDDRLKTIHAQIMGRVQLEILQRLIAQRFRMDVTFDSGRIFYKETIENTVEGVGHYEPLRHYAEVHLILSPLPRGSGLVFDSQCPTDVLEAGYQNLILTHLAEKTHLGVLTGSPITDMRLTLAAGKAHLKHTEGGDFRQATYRAVRQGLMQARSLLLEPWYKFILILPAPQIGRAITDIRAMSGEFDPPETTGELSTLRGLVPASELGDYADTLAAYTQGRGRLQLSPAGYRPCHNAQEVIAGLDYDPEADQENSPDSVFCVHGAGYLVKWNQVPEYMHLESALKTEKPQVLVRNLRPDDKELEAIMEREFGPIRRPLYRPTEPAPGTEKLTITPPRPQYLIVDGYNIIFAWEELAEIAKSDLDAARRRLMDDLSSYAGYKQCRLVLVFDGYRVKGNPGEKTTFHNIQVVYTKEGETADAYMEALVERVGKNYALRVATSDALVQLSSFRSGVLRMSSRELREEVALAKAEMKKHFRK